MRAATRANPTPVRPEASGRGTPVPSLLESIRRGASTDSARPDRPTWVVPSRQLAAGLVLYGLEPGDRVAILGGPRPEGLLGILATAAARGVAVPIDPSRPEAAWRKALAEHGVRFALVEDAGALDRLLVLRPELPTLELALVFRPPGGDRPSPARTVAALSADGERALAADPDLLDRGSGGSEGAVLAGAGGTAPRARSLSDLERAASEIGETFGVSPTDVVFVSLELGGGADLDALLATLLAGATLEAPSRESEDPAATLREVRPTVAVVDPETIAKLEASVGEAFERRGFLRRRLAKWSLARPLESERRPRAARLGRRLALDRLVEETMGGRLRVLACPGDPPRAERLAALGVDPKGLPPRT